MEEGEKRIRNKKKTRKTENIRIQKSRDDREGKRMEKNGSRVG